MEQIYLACKILDETSTERHVQGKLFDGTLFEIQAPYWDVIPEEDRAWLLVQVLGRDNKNVRLSIRLPAPVISLGHNINVAIADTKAIS